MSASQTVSAKWTSFWVVNPLQYGQCFFVRAATGVKEKSGEDNGLSGEWRLLPCLEGIGLRASNFLLEKFIEPYFGWFNRELDEGLLQLFVDCSGGRQEISHLHGGVLKQICEASYYCRRFRPNHKMESFGWWNFDRCNRSLSCRICCLDEKLWGRFLQVPRVWRPKLLPFFHVN